MDKQKLDAWITREDERIDPDEPEECDLVTYDHVYFWEVGGTTGQPVLIVGEGQELWPTLEAYMDAQEFWPNVWFVSDHGNAHLMTKD
jgi:hypothetical protein